MNDDAVVTTTGIQRVFWRQKQQIDLCRGQFVPVRLNGSRIGGKVRVLVKLQRIDIDADNNAIAGESGLTDQRQVTVVQIAHGRHK